MAEGSKVLKCSCVSEFQDKEYGKGMRVFSPTAKVDKSSGRRQWRCTVCKTLKTA